jgi:hypothetical protein
MSEDDLVELIYAEIMAQDDCGQAGCDTSDNQDRSNVLVFVGIDLRQIARAIRRAIPT